MNRSSFLSLIAILVIAYCGYLALGTGAKPPIITPSEPLADNLEQAPDYYLINPRVTQYSLDGNKDYLLVSDKISHYPHNDVSLLAQPNIDLYRTNGNQWKTTAKHGRLLPGGDILELSDQVRVKEQKSSGELGILLKTNFLTLYAEEEVADTQHPVVITSPNGSITHGVGMRAFLAKDRVQLFSNVRGQYEVNQ
ncbi:LPS export ABC transporter periplasmic protein LptC [Spartinivicinus ruber]|uniref:LPS export ABC transporter periplasmic protein LptC n=1 Tax=Spartinivicinus ruber TaxID=2683272 RepID=UPI0013D2C165|nr:LPS export ABC transporter periplasmic protein LptC [Spartinivicinus ruber]